MEELKNEYWQTVVDDNDTDQPEEMSRRQALAALGKFAVCTAPITTTLLTAEKASAWSVPGPPGPMPPGFMPPG